MTTGKFISMVQAYYGEYAEVVRKAVERWLSRKTDGERSKIMESLMRTYSNRWKTPPDVATLEEAEGKIDRGHPDLTPDREYDPEKLIEEGHVSEEEAKEYFERLYQIVGKGRDAAEGGNF